MITPEKPLGTKDLTASILSLCVALCAPGLLCSGFSHETEYVLKCSHCLDCPPLCLSCSSQSYSAHHGTQRSLFRFPSSPQAGALVSPCPQVGVSWPSISLASLTELGGVDLGDCSLSVINSPITHYAESVKYGLVHRLGL